MLPNIAANVYLWLDQNMSYFSPEILSIVLTTETQYPFNRQIFLYVPIL